MKTYLNVAIISLSLCVLFSCNRAENRVENPDNNDLESREIAIIQSQKYRHLSRSRRIIPSKDNEFLSDDITSSMMSSSRYKNNWTKSGSDSEDEYDSSEEIPIDEEVYENLIIYYDGGIEFTQETVLDTTSNPILAVYDYPLDLSHYVSRVEIVDGICCSYSRDGGLLYEGPTNVPDMHELILEMEAYSEGLYEEEEGDTRSAPLKGRDRLENILSRQLRGLSKADYLITETHEGIEVSIKVGDSMETNALYDDGSLSVTKMDLIVGGQLVERQVFGYDNNSMMQAITGDKLLKHNPSVMKTMKIGIFADGSPCMIEDTRVYSENRMTYIPRKMRK